MPRLPRNDHPGSWHHVMNRGIARRTTFESRADVRMFLALLALEVRRGLLEVHAYAVLTTHVHLLVRSLRGELAHAMQRVFNGYVRYFNRTRRRDGSLFRGRYRSRPVESRIYRALLVPYIDFNAVRAGAAQRPADHAYGSARAWFRGKAPPWLAHDWIAEVLRVPGIGAPDAWARYQQYFGWYVGPELLRVVEGRLAIRRACEDPLESLVLGTPARVQEWMIRKAALADQTRPGLPLAPPRIVLAVWQSSLASIEGVVRGRSGPCRLRCHVARAGLLRDLCGLTYARIGALVRGSASQARADLQRHASLLRTDRRYLEACAKIASEALHRTHGGRAPLGEPREYEPGTVRRG